MNPAKIVIREMQSNRSFQMRKFLTEGVRQSGESANCHPHGEVLPFHMRSADVVRIGVASSDFGKHLDDWTWGVPRIGVMLAPFTKQFHQLREVTIQTERMRNAFCVMTQAVSCDLGLAVHAVVQVPEKLPCIFLMTLADVEGRNE